MHFAIYFFRTVYMLLSRCLNISAINRPEVEECFFKRGGSFGYLGTEDIPEERISYSTTYQVALNCIWKIEVAEGWQVNDEKYSF